MDRREFLKTSAVVASFIATSPLDILGEAKRSRVYVAAGKDAIYRLFEKSHLLQKVVTSGMRVLIKPNFSFANHPEAGTTTKPEIVRAIAEMCVQCGAREVRVVDNTIRSPKLCLERTGIKDALRGLKKVKISIPKKKREFKEVKIPQGRSLKAVEVAKECLESDLVINVPVAKSHSATIVSIGLKNLMGLIFDRWSFHSKYDLDQAIADLATAVKPALTVVDLTRCITTGGPSGPGKVEEAGLVALSSDPVAADAFAITQYRWWGRWYEPKQVRHILAAHKLGLGEIDLDSIEIINV